MQSLASESSLFQPIQLLYIFIPSLNIYSSKELHSPRKCESYIALEAPESEADHAPFNQQRLIFESQLEAYVHYWLPDATFWG